MKFVTVSEAYFRMLSTDREVLFRENRRPHLLVVSLTYQGRRHNFAVPLRSNIPHSALKEHYFALPPRPSTRPGNHHGLHYIKMFPINKSAQEKFWVGKQSSYILYQQIINKHQKEIVAACQAYLDSYTNGARPPYSVDIDKALRCLDTFISQSTEHKNA